MYPFLKKARVLHTTSLYFYSNIIHHSLSLKSSDFAKLVHAQLIKIGLNTHTFLGNRCIDLYSKLGEFCDALQVFDEIPNKNIISWNVCLNVFVKSGDICNARALFDKMPQRDVVSWNSMISGYASSGCFNKAVEIFMQMQNVGVRPSGFTFSILVSLVSCVHHGKEIHGCMIRRGVNFSNVVVGNSLIDMYGKLGLIDYAFGVFLTMRELDSISWNSIIAGCCNLGYGQLAWNQFFFMISSGYSSDEFTASTILTVCTDLRDFEKGKQIFALCVKMGFLSNTVVSSAAIDLFSKCNRLEDSVRLFEETKLWDSIICNSMISSYSAHGFWEGALTLFVLTLRENVKPTNFTISIVLSCSSSLFLAELGSQFHSLVVKLGFESDLVIASSLTEMYSKVGLIDSAIKIFAKMGIKDLISWNSMILGMTQNGRVTETLDLFKKLLVEGPPPDRITLSGVLLACNYGGFVDEGLRILSLMEKQYGVKPTDEHYAGVVEMVSQSCELKEAMGILVDMPYGQSAPFWESILRACTVHGDLKLTEKVAERLIQYKPQWSLPYLILARAYEMRGRWESMVRVKKAMRERGVKKVIGCSWIQIRNRVCIFKSNHVVHYSGKDIYTVLKLLGWEMEDEGYVCQKYDNTGVQGEKELSIAEE